MDKQLSAAVVNETQAVIKGTVAMPGKKVERYWHLSRPSLPRRMSKSVQFGTHRGRVEKWGEAGVTRESRAASAESWVRVRKLNARAGIAANTILREES